MLKPPRLLVGVVLAGGASSRMGRDKARLVYDGRVQVWRVADLLAPYCCEVVLSRHRSTRQSDGDLAQSIRIVEDPGDERLGPLAGLLAVHEAFPDADLLIVPCDQPRLTGVLIGRLIDAFAAAQTECVQAVDVACFRHPGGEFEPMPSLWSSRRLAAIKAHDQGPKLPGLMAQLGGPGICAVTLHSDELAALQNVNDPEAYQSVAAPKTDPLPNQARAAAFAVVPQL